VVLMLRRLSLRWLIPLTLVVLLLPACSDSASDVAATTVAPPETATTAPVVTSTTLSEAAAIATVEALHEACNAYDSDAALALFADVASWHGETPGSPGWEQEWVEMEAWGRQSTLSDCEMASGRLTCLDTWEWTNLSGKAGVFRVSEWAFRFDDQGLIANAYIRTDSKDDDLAFRDALGTWMATTHPESYETFFHAVNAPDGTHPTLTENWLDRVAELSPLIDEFVAQSDEYPLSPAA
jgi:hypothetical protein